MAHSVATDHLTGANVVTSSTGVVEELADYYPYGDVRLDEKSGTFSEQRKYAGQELDVDTGLSYMNARYYSGKMGRFISQDPMALYSPEKLLGDPQSLNSYAYARNNPMRYVDPTGEVSMEFWKGLPHQFGVDISNSSRGIAQGFYSISDRFNNQGIASYTPGSMQAAMISDLAGGVVDNIANVIDPRVSNSGRVFAVGMTVADVGSGGKGKAAGTAVSQAANIVKAITEPRPKFWANTLEGAWNTAKNGPGKTKLCPTCGKQLTGSKINGIRDFDLDHFGKTWNERVDIIKNELKNGVEWTRQQVINLYQKDVRIQCPTCNRSNKFNSK